jgi:hypothetical protein
VEVNTTGAPWRPEHVQRAADVHVAVTRRILHRHRDHRLGAEVEHALGASALEHRAKRLGVGDVHQRQLRTRVEVAVPARGEVVDNDHLVVVAKQRVDHV